MDNTSQGMKSIMNNNPKKCPAKIFSGQPVPKFDTQCLKVISWNVHDIKDRVIGHKTEIDEFKQVLHQGLIFCL